MKKGAMFFYLVVCFSYAQQASMVPLPFQKDLIPEGIAIDAKKGKVYLNSLKHNKIVRCNLDGGAPELFIEPNEHDYLSGFGMTIVGDTIYALGNVLPKKGNKSVFLKLNHKSGALVDKYAITDERFIYLNDLAVDKFGTAYITDSKSNDLYTVNQSNNLEVFFSHDAIKHSNGIAISPDGTRLYLATYTSGIRVLDIASKKLLNQPNDYKGIDGLKYRQGSLYAIVNSKRDVSQNGVFRFTLNQNGSDVLIADKIWEFENPTHIPTTFAIYEDSMYFISDSQLWNFDQELNQIIEPGKLKNYKLVQLKL